MAPTERGRNKKALEESMRITLPAGLRNKHEACDVTPPSAELRRLSVRLLSSWWTWR